MGVWMETVGLTRSYLQIAWPLAPKGDCVRLNSWNNANYHLPFAKSIKASLYLNTANVTRFLYLPVYLSVDGMRMVCNNM